MRLFLFLVVKLNVIDFFGKSGKFSIIHTF